MPRHLSIAALFFGPLAAACSCDESPLITVDPGIRIDAGLPLDATIPDPPPPVDAGPADSGEPEARILRFDGTSPLALYYGASVDLRFVLETVSGAAVAGEAVRFSQAGGNGTLGASSTRTSATGDTTVRFTAGRTTGAVTLTAEADLAPPITVTIDVREDPAAALILVVTSTARIDVTSADALVYLGGTMAAPSCAQLSLGTPPAPAIAAAFAAVPGTRTFAGLATGSSVTVFATGKNARGDVVARGCTEGPRLAGGTSTQVEVTLVQLPTELEGDYDVLLRLDAGRTLPEPYQSVVVLITDLLSDPAGWAIYQTLALVDRNYGTSFVRWTPPGSSTERRATFEEVRMNNQLFNTWRIASNALDNFLATQLGQTYIDVTNVGADIHQAVRAFEVGARYTLTSSGTPGRLEVTEGWQAMVFQWQLGCPLNDLGCARRPFELSGPNAHLAPALTTYGATVHHAPLLTPAPGQSERFRLALDAHQINVRYGAIVLLVLNQLVFPNLPASVAGNSLTQVLRNIVGCTDVAIALSNATGLSRSFFETLCDSAVSAAAASVEARLLALGSANQPGLVTGPGGGDLILTDEDQDLRPELVPEVSTRAQWSTGSPPVSTPIDGDGRRAATDCGSDADCDAGRACVPISSYLEVRALEHDCRKAIGPMLGALGCATDADCGSGICFDPGSGIRICYAACQSAACTLGSCTPDVLELDLNPVRMGLGRAPVSACVP